MGMRARLERDLTEHKRLATIAYTPHYRNYIARRIHLLEFVLSGRYTELQRQDERKRWAKKRQELATRMSDLTS